MAKDEWPKTLYCAQDDDGNGPYLAYKHAREVAKPDETVPVAVYKFVGVFDVLAPVDIKGAVVAKAKQGK